MHSRRSLVLALGLMGVALITSLTARPGAAAFARPQPPPPSGPLTWIQPYSWTGDWTYWSQQAADYDVGGTDWRLPTVEEIQSAITDGSFGTTTGTTCWSSRTQGTWAYAVFFSIDADGRPIPSTMSVVRTVKRSSLQAKFVRR